MKKLLLALTLVNAGMLLSQKSAEYSQEIFAAEKTKADEKPARKTYFGGYFSVAPTSWKINTPYGDFTSNTTTTGIGLNLLTGIKPKVATDYSLRVYLSEFYTMYGFALGGNYMLNVPIYFNLTFDLDYLEIKNSSNSLFMVGGRIESGYFFVLNKKNTSQAKQILVPNIFIARMGGLSLSEDDLGNTYSSTQYGIGLKYLFGGGKNTNGSKNESSSPSNDNIMR